MGAEYLKGSKNSFFYSAAAEDLTDFYSTPGNAYHLYVTKKFTDTLSLRLGYTQQESEYTSLFLGEVSESDRKVTTGYANFRLDF